MQESRQALCGYGVPHIDDNKKAALHAYSTKAMPQQNCKCKPNVTGNAKVKMKEATQQVYKQLVPCALDRLGVKPVQRRVSESIQNENLDERGAQARKRKQLEPEQAFPTEAREREKQKKKEGYVAKKKQKIVEDHYDDLGDDLSGLGPNL